MPAEPVTCSGMCCAAFTLSGGADVLERLKDGRTEEFHQPGQVRLRDILVPLTQAEARERLRQVGSTGGDEVQPIGAHMFTCNRWDPATRLCTVYEQRPEMCRDYRPEKCQHRKGGCGHA